MLLLVSFGLKGYLHFFDSYNKTYGSLGAVIDLMLWLYLTAVAVLIGGELNSEIENAAAQQGAPDAKPKRVREPSDLGGTKQLDESSAEKLSHIRLITCDGGRLNSNQRISRQRSDDNRDHIDEQSPEWSR